MRFKKLLDPIVSFKINKTSKSFAWDVFQVSVSILLAILAFVVTNAWAESLSEKAEQVGVIVAGKDLSAPKTLEEGDLVVRFFRRDLLPKSAIPEKSFNDILGVTLIHPLSSGQILTTTEIAGKIDPELGGFVVPRNAKGFSIPSNWLSAPFPRMKKGDTVTIAFGGNEKDKNISGIVAQGVPVLSVEKGDGNNLQSILVGLDEKLALNLVELRAGGFQLAVAVDGVAPESTIFKK